MDHGTFFFMLKLTLRKSSIFSLWIYSYVKKSYFCTRFKMNKLMAGWTVYQYV